MALQERMMRHQRLENEKKRAEIKQKRTELIKESVPKRIALFNETVVKSELETLVNHKPKILYSEPMFLVVTMMEEVEV